MKPNYELIFKRSPLALMIMDTSFRIVGANDVYLKLLGRTLEQIVGGYVWDMFPANPSDEEAAANKDIFQKSFEQARDTKITTFLGPIRFDVTVDGVYKTRVWEINNDPILDDDGNTVYIVNLARDVTDKVEVEDKLKLVDSILDDLIAKYSEENNEQSNRNLRSGGPREGD